MLGKVEYAEAAISIKQCDHSQAFAHTWVSVIVGSVMVGGKWCAEAVKRCDHTWALACTWMSAVVGCVMLGRKWCVEATISIYLYLEL